MEKIIDGNKIPETQKGFKYSWIRAEADDVSHYEDVDEKGIDKITGFTISRPVIVIGVDRDIIDQINIKGILNGLIDNIDDEMYCELESFNCYDGLYPRYTKKGLEDNFKKFIKDNFDINPEHILDTFYLKYDLLNDKWIKE